MAKKQLSFRTHRALIELQGLNGIEMGIILLSHQACVNIIHFIAKQMLQRLVQIILVTDTYFSLIFDESTTNAKKQS